MRSISDLGALLFAALLLGGAPAHAGEVAVWEEIVPSGDAPAARSGSTMAYDGFDVVLVGGWDGDCSGETWTWNGTSWTRFSGSGGPAPRYSMAAAHDTQRGVVVFYGGYCDSQGYYNSAYEWDGAWHHPTPGTVPYARDEHAMAYDAHVGFTILHGGEYGGSVLLNSWYWDGSVWNMQAEGPNRLGHGMAYDAARQQTIIYGGHDDSATPAFFDDTWRWTGSAWTRISSSGPGARAEHGMVYDDTRTVVVVFGGATGTGYGTQLGDTWQWNGSTWTELQLAPGTSGPPARYHHGMAFDRGRRRAVVHGGRDRTGTLLGDTWELHTRGGACSTADTCHTGYCVESVCCETASCAACYTCDGSNPGVCAPVTDGTPCTGGQCWGGTCQPLGDGGLPPDGPPQEDAAQSDAGSCCADGSSADAGDASHDRRGWVGWGCALGGDPTPNLGALMLGLILLLPNLGPRATNLGRRIRGRRGP